MRVSRGQCFFLPCSKVVQFSTAEKNWGAENFTNASRWCHASDEPNRDRISEPGFRIIQQQPNHLWCTTNYFITVYQIFRIIQSLDVISNAKIERTLLLHDILSNGKSSMLVIAISQWQTFHVGKMVVFIYPDWKFCSATKCLLITSTIGSWCCLSVSFLELATHFRTLYMHSRSSFSARPIISNIC